MNPRPAGQIETPCVQVCMIERKTGLCMGCFRTGEEISNWSILTRDARSEIVAALPVRRMMLGPELFDEA